MVIREKYLAEIRPFYDSDLVKIITGVRRCGKSIILEQIKDEISKRTGNILSLNFEDFIDYEKIHSAKGILDFVDKNRKKGKCYVFLDEIQLVDNWADAVKTLRLHDVSVFISGSNSKLLSSEFATELSGRYVSFRIRPFVYKEIVEYCRQLSKECSISDYIVWGGFPKRFELDNQLDLRRYFLDLKETIIIKDLIKRHNIKKEALFRKVVNYILRSNSRIFSSRSVCKYIKNDEPSCSSNTILNYLSFLKEAYVIDEIPQFSTKTRQELSYYNKLYNCDVAFNSLGASDNVDYDIDHNFENIVYNELLYMGYQLKVYNNSGREIDFIATKNNLNFFVQVSYTLTNKKTFDREFGAFNGLDNKNMFIVISNDDFDFSTSNIRHIKFKDFVMMDELS